MGEGPALPRAAEDLDGLVETSRPFLERDSERAELFPQPSGADAKHEATRGDVVRGHGRTRGRERMPQRGDVDAGREPEARRRAGDGTEEHPRIQQLRIGLDDRREGCVVGLAPGTRGVRARVAARQHDVLAEPQRVESEFVGGNGNVEQARCTEVVRADPDPHRGRPRAAAGRR